MLSPGSRDLFSQSILQSSAASNPWAMVTAQEARLRAGRLAELLKCPHEEVSQLPALPLYVGTVGEKNKGGNLNLFCQSVLPSAKCNF